MLTLIPVALFHAWNVNGEIPDIDAPRAKSTMKIAQAEARVDKLMAARHKAYLETLTKADADAFKKTHTGGSSRNYKKHYDNVLTFCAALCLLGNQTITPHEAA